MKTFVDIVKLAASVLHIVVCTVGGWGRAGGEQYTVKYIVSDGLIGEEDCGDVCPVGGYGEASLVTDRCFLYSPPSKTSWDSTNLPALKKCDLFVSGTLDFTQKCVLYRYSIQVNSHKGKV